LAAKNLADEGVAFMSSMEFSTGSGTYDFSRDWFSANITAWDHIFRQEKPRRVLEIGSFEGRSACYTIEKLGALFSTGASLTCVDNWIGGQEHRDAGGFYQAVMSDTERRFDHNMRVALAKVGNRVTLSKVKQNSREALARLLIADPIEQFDLIFIDGSHEAPDVLADSVLAFPLLRVGGTLIFDDYIWSDQAPEIRDPLRMPKIAIDAFVNIYQRKLEFYHRLPLWQFYLRKVAS
jgi:predicted O-methyltransferase YrrM